MRQHERGMALFTALLLSTVLVLLVSMSIRYALTSSKTMQVDRARAQALNVAEGGVEWAVSRFDPTALGSLATSSAFAGGEYTLTARPLPNNRFAVRAEAWVPASASPEAHRLIEVVLATGSNPLGNFAMATDGNLSLNGSVTFNSTPAAGQGNIHSNSDVDINGGSTTIQGSVSATDQVSPATYPGVTGSVSSQAPQVEISSYTSPQIQAFATDARALGTHSLSDPLGTTLSGYYQSYGGYDILDSANITGGSLSISGGTYTISGTVFIEGNLSISGNARLQGNGLIVVTQKISISGNPYVEGTKASQLGLVTLSSRDPAIDLGGANNIRAIVFAPNGNVAVHGNVNMTGSMIARGVGIVQGSVTMTRDTNQNVDVLGIPYWRTESYREL
ncbi:MAG TPA: polymer-forming cytoskeletal protein [Stenomitos sp.]